MKKIPQRTCMGCNQKKDKNQLIRIIKNNNEIIVDKTGKKEGRGAYICNDIHCLDNLIKNKRLEKVFEMEIPQEIYESLRGVILDK